jgi:uncharacterized RDD family membrane protein YckC
MLPFLSMIGLRPKPLDDGPRYAYSNDRCMASAIDIALLFFLLHGVSTTLTEQVYAWYGQPAPGTGPVVSSFQQLAGMLWETRYPWLISNGIVVLMLGAVYVAFQLAYATTPGKWLLGLRIVDAKTFEPIHGWRYVWRFLAYIPASLPLMIGIIWASFNKQHRGWHDYMAGTVVIYTRPKGWAWQKMKQGFFWLKAKTGFSRAVKEPVGEPAPEQRHEDGGKPVG